MILNASSNSFEIKNNLDIQAQLVVWDSKAFNFNVAAINALKINTESDLEKDYKQFLRWIDEHKIKLVSCRLLHNHINESFFLEEHGFKFIEMVLHPFINLETIETCIRPDNALRISEAIEADIEKISRIANNSFKHERYYIDPRIENQLSDNRYSNWVKNTANNPLQTLIKIQEGEKIVGFFIIEELEDNCAYWHLTALNPEFHGQGYGKMVWREMLYYHRQNAIKTIKTTISARNVSVLNLYSSLNFRFLPPEMTFHWYKYD